MGYTLQELANPKDSELRVDWHVVALPIVQARRDIDYFISWLRHLPILRPIPSLINGEYDEETLEQPPMFLITAHGSRVFWLSHRLRIPGSNPTLNSCCGT
jgi:hypothetical protein